MQHFHYIKPATVDRIVANWLAPQIERYVEWMDSQGYATRNVYRRVPVLCQFGEFAKQKGITEASAATALVEEFAAKWLADHGRNCRTAEARSKVAEEARNPVRQMLMLAAMSGDN
jgi:hypothetical protein